MMMNGFPRRFGPYVLLKPLARGGMGALYLALHGQPGMEKLCVVKTALPHLADRGYLQRFRDEAKVVVRLSHGNLVAVFDADEVKGEIYLAMEYVAGKDLRAVWNRCAQKGVAFPVAVAAHIARELARGLDYAHSFGELALVHRDVSPPNVLLSYTGEVKLTDFGLATSTLKLEKTAPGVIYGKVSYMAPEQARGEALDPRTDLYAAGIILWELLTGRQLFPPGARVGKDSDDDLLERVRKPDLQPPSRRASRVPPELDAICMRALALDPRNRYQKGEQLRSDLAAFVARTAPDTDGAQVARFLRELFGEEIVKERLDRERLALSGRRLLAPVPAAVDTGARTNPEHADEEELTAVDKRSAAAQGVPAASESAIQRAVELEEEGAQEHRETGLQPEPRETSQIVGTVLAGRYRIKRLCGEGGMGRVYEAEHIEIGKRVAVKVLHPAYTRTPDVVERFRREARAASKMNHPNIVNVTDSGTTEEGAFFFVMEYIEGVELGFVIHKSGPLAPTRALRIAEQMCEALQVAHDCGVIHRDLKPENILLVGNGPRSLNGLRPIGADRSLTAVPLAPEPGDFVKVLDFGIAKSAEVEEATKPGRRLTRPGVAMGTPEYMAPEQAAGRAADPRSDIYAVGSIMYEMLTGIAPYDGDNVMEVLHKKANETPRAIRQLRPEVPAEVEALVDRAMARVPEARPQSMAEFAAEIRAVEFLVARAPSAPQPVRRDSPLFAGAVDPTAGLGALGLSRRSLTIASAALATVGLIVVVRAATRAQPLPEVPVVRTATVPPAAALPPPRPTDEEPTVEPAPSPPWARPGVQVGRPAPRPPAVAGKELLARGKKLLQAHRYDEAKEVLGKLVASRARERGDALIALGKIAFQEQKYDEAVLRFKEASRAGAGDEAQVLLGDAYYKLGKYDDAKKAYNEALRRNPENDATKRKLQLAARNAK